ncbi:major facilitator transporter [Burkholderia contaminans]|nr:major facilitator transporter [Burkholderia contaminans]
MIPCTLALCRAQSLPPVLSATITGMLAPCLHMPGDTASLAVSLTQIDYAFRLFVRESLGDPR